MPVSHLRFYRITSVFSDQVIFGSVTLAPAGAALRG